MNTKPVSLIWWDNLTPLDKHFLIKKHLVKNASKKSIDKIYRLEIKQLIKAII